MNWTHDRDHIRLLHNAHADHTESTYRGMQQMPGNPAGVVIRQIGPTRTFIANGDRLENRAIFCGEETDEQIDEVLRHFIDHAAQCVIEMNPANYYVNPPFTWEKRLLKRLLHQGCRIDDFRCVWCRCQPPGVEKLVPSRWRLARFGAGEKEDFSKLASRISAGEQWTAETRAAQTQPGWFHYVAFDEEQPCALGTLFCNGPTGYLAWWYTHPDHRGKGLQQAGIQQRTRDAFGLGCQRVFTVTDFNFSSPRNLQRRGFHLAYNYLLLRRDPTPLA